MLEEELKLRIYRQRMLQEAKRQVDLNRRTIETFGLMKGQKVAKHVRKDPRTGQRFIAGQGGTGSPEKVLAEKKTVAGSGVGEKIGSMIGNGKSSLIGFPSESSVLNPDILETLIRNFQNATIDEIREITNELFKQPRSRDRGYMAELLLKELMRRSLMEEGDVKRLMESNNGEKEKKEEASKKEESKSKEMKNNNADKG